MNTINQLWDKWVGDHNDDDVTEIIAYYRKQLALYDSGVKPKKVEAENVDMTKILADIKARSGASTPKPTIKSKGGLRRL